MPKNEKENKAKNANVLDAQTNKRIYISHSLYKKYSYQCVNKCLSPSRHSPRQHTEFKDIEKASAHRKRQQAANPANRKQVKVTLPQVKSQSSLVATKPYSASLTLSHAHTHTHSLSFYLSLCQSVKTIQEWVCQRIHTLRGCCEILYNASVAANGFLLCAELLLRLRKILISK